MHCTEFKIKNQIKLVILDRDGVINQDSPDFIKSPAEWHAITGSLAAITKLNRAGFKVAVATNQSGIARGYFSSATLEAIHEKMRAELAAVGGYLDGVFICPHGPEDNCECRKPKPGLLWQIAEFFAVKPAETILIGDALRDLQAAKAFGCCAILVKTGKGTNTLNDPNLTNSPELSDALICDDLAAAVDEILANHSDN